MRRLVYFLIGFLLAVDIGLVYAAPVSYQFRGMSVTRENGVSYFRGTAPSELAAAPVASASSSGWYMGTGALLGNGGVMWMGKTAEFVSSHPVALEAAAVAVSAVRLNPTGLVTSAIASYLLSKGIDYSSGQFMVPGQPLQTVQLWHSSASYESTPEAACTAAAAEGPWPYQNTVPCGSAYVTNNGTKCNLPVRLVSNTTTCPAVWYWPQTLETLCPDKSAPVNGTCGNGQTRPAEDADWNAARTGKWPDPAIRDLVRNGVPLPTDQPVFSPTSRDIPVADPVVDPVTGKRLQDVARITPQPSNPQVADVQMVKQEVDANGNPVVNPSTGTPVAPTEEKDPCKLNPEASACKPLDEVPDVDLPTKDITISINPVSGFGPDSGTCPASKTLFTKGGQPAVWSWQMYCDFSTGIRPFILGFAWIAAISMVVAVGRRQG